MNALFIYFYFLFNVEESLLGMECNMHVYIFYIILEIYHLEQISRKKYYNYCNSDSLKQ